MAKRSSAGKGRAKPRGREAKRESRTVRGRAPEVVVFKRRSLGPTETGSIIDEVARADRAHARAALDALAAPVGFPRQALTVERIAPALHGCIVPIESLRHDPQNAREHGPRSIDALKSMLARFGQQKNIVATRDGVVVAGNGLLAAARALGWRFIAVSTLDTDDVNEARAFALADNRVAELSTWIPEALGESLSALHDMPELASLGFSSDDLDELMAELADGQAAPGPTADAPGGGVGLGVGGPGPDGGVEGDDDEDGEHPRSGQSVRMTDEQRAVFDRALVVMRRREGEDISDGRCLELLAAEFLSGA